MNVRDLSVSELAGRFRAEGLCWRSGPFVVRARTSVRFVAEQIAFLYADFPLAEGGCYVDFDVSVRAADPFAWWVHIFVDGAAHYRWFRRHLAMPLFEWTLNGLLFDRPHQYLMLHAAVVERDGKAAILPAPPGSGKSTLCAALVHRGWRLLSDEATLVRLSDGAIDANPRPIGLKEESIATIRQFLPGAVLGPSWPGTPKGVVAHVRPPSQSVRRAHEVARPAWLIFPQFRAGKEPEVVPVSRGRALLRAAENSFNYITLGRRGFEALADLVDGCDCYEFTYNSLEAAVQWFEQLCPSETFGSPRPVQLVQ